MEYLVDPIEQKVAESLEKLFGPHDNMVKAAVKLSNTQYSPEEEEMIIAQMKALNAKEAKIVEQYSCTLDASGNIVSLHPEEDNIRIEVVDSEDAVIEDQKDLLYTA